MRRDHHLLGDFPETKISKFAKENSYSKRWSYHLVLSSRQKVQKNKSLPPPAPSGLTQPDVGPREPLPQAKPAVLPILAPSFLPASFLDDSLDNAIKPRGNTVQIKLRQYVPCTTGA